MNLARIFSALSRKEASHRASEFLWKEIRRYYYQKTKRRFFAPSNLRFDPVNYGVIAPFE